MVTAATARTPRAKAGATKADVEDAIRIKPLAIKRIVVRIKGTQPLITNKFSEEAEAKLAESQSGPSIKGAKAPRNPEAEFLAARYLIEDRGDNEDDVCGFPAAGIKKAIVAAAMRVTEAKGTWVRAVINVEGEAGTGLVRIYAPGPKMRTDHVVQAGRGNLRYRPQFHPWEMDVPITFNADQISASDVVNLLQQAGFAIGIGDWRPEKNGTSGTFTVVSQTITDVESFSA